MAKKGKAKVKRIVKRKLKIKKVKYKLKKHPRGQSKKSKISKVKKLIKLAASRKKKKR